MNNFLSYSDIKALHNISRLIDFDQDGKYCHSLRVAYVGSLLAEKLSPESLQEVFVAGLLHDIGTFNVEHDHIHMLSGSIDDLLPVVRVHPQKGAAIIATLPGFGKIAKIVMEHHEWCNGNGYPRGLTAKDIRMESQIVRIADRCSFIINAIGDIDLDQLIDQMNVLVGEEFSKDLYEALTDILKDEKTFQTVKSDEQLIEASENFYKECFQKTDNPCLDDRFILKFIGRVLDAKNTYTEGHSQRVSYFSALIALALDFNEPQLRLIERAAYLHDIGKIGIPNTILDKQGPLTSEEVEIMKSHVEHSYAIVNDISAFKPITDIVGCDQEKYNGSGYPKGLSGNEIPIEARIISIADAFDAMTSQRSYNKAVSTSKALSELKRAAGSDFDPHIVSIACKVFEGFKNSSILASYNYIL